jgi:hypothetical protein
MTLMIPPSFAALVGAPAWTDNVTYSGGDYEADYPVTNWGTLPLSQVARTTSLDAADCKVIGTLDRIRGVKVISFHGDNLTLQGRNRCEVFQGAAQTDLVWDSGMIERWPPVFPFAGNVGAPDWYDTNFWDSKYTEEQLSDTSWMNAFVIPDIVPCLSFRLSFEDADNPANYLQFGYATVSNGTQMSVNYAYGSDLGFNFRTISQEGWGGVKGFDRRNKPRQFNGTVNLPRGESMSVHYERLRRMDLDKPFLWLPFPDDPSKWLQEAYLARNSESGNKIREASFDRQGVPLNFEEVL